MLRALYVAGRSLPRTGAEELAAGSDLAAGKTDGAVIDLVGSEEAEAAARTTVQRAGDLVTTGLSEVGQRGAFGEILADETVCIFVGAALPGMVRSGEVDRGAEGALEVHVAVELDAVVGGDGAHRVRFAGEKLDQACVRVLDRSAGQRPQADKPTETFHGGRDARFAFAVHSVRFPVAEAAALLDDAGAIADRALAGEPTAVVVSAVAFAPAFACTPEIAPERTAGTFVAPDPQVDRLVAHDRQAIETAAAGDLLRTPALAQQRLDGREVGGTVAGVATRAPAPRTRHFHCERGPIRPIVARGVALHLSRNRAGMPLQRRRDLPRREALLPQDRNLIPFLRAQLPISHPLGMSHLLPESKEPNKALEPTPTSVTPPAYAGVAPAAVVAHL